jgi:hypothetical protein
VEDNASAINVGMFVIQPVGPRPDHAAKDNAIEQFA